MVDSPEIVVAHSMLLVHPEAALVVDSGKPVVTADSEVADSVVTDSVSYSYYISFPYNEGL